MLGKGLKRKDLFGLTVSEVLVYGGLPPCFGASSQAEGPRGRMRWNKAVQFIAAREGKEREGEEGNPWNFPHFPFSPGCRIVTHTFREVSYSLS